MRLSFVILLLIPSKMYGVASGCDSPRKKESLPSHSSTTTTMDGSPYNAGLALTSKCQAAALDNNPIEDSVSPPIEHKENATTSKRKAVAFNDDAPERSALTTTDVQERKDESFASDEVQPSNATVQKKQTDAASKLAKKFRSVTPIPTNGSGGADVSAVDPEIEEEKQAEGTESGGNRNESGKTKIAR